MKRIHPEDLVKFRVWLGAVSSEGAGAELELRWILPNGSIRWVRARSAVIRDEDGKATGTVGTADDITASKDLEAELRVAKDAAEAANRAKDVFLANVSHEFRTPLNGILGMAQVLRLTPLDAEQADCVETLQQSGESLLKLVDHVLDLSRGGWAKADPAAGEFRVSTVVRQAAALIEEQAEAKLIELRTEVSDDLPDRLIGDAARIQQVLNHLLSNAVKFTDRGSILLQVRGEFTDCSMVDVVFAVQDTGPGIPEQDLELLFQPFTQLDGSSTRRHGGTGVGLAITRKRAEVMGGQVGCESEPGRGSTFWLRLRLRIAPEGTGAAYHDADWETSKPANCCSRTLPLYSIS